MIQSLEATVVVSNFNKLRIVGKTQQVLYQKMHATTFNTQSLSAWWTLIYNKARPNIKKAKQPHDAISLAKSLAIAVFTQPPLPKYAF